MPCCCQQGLSRKTTNDCCPSATPQSWKSGISRWTNSAWFRKSCPVVLPCGCVDSDQEVCASGKASNVLFALVKHRGLVSLWHPRFIFDYGSIRDYETYINWDTWYMQTISYIFNWLSHCVCFGKLWYRSVCKIQLDMGSLYSFVFAR